MGLNFWKPPPSKFDLNVPLEAGIFKELGYMKNQGNYIYQVMGTLTDTTIPTLGFITGGTTLPSSCRIFSITGAFTFPSFFANLILFDNQPDYIVIMNGSGFLDFLNGYIWGFYTSYFHDTLTGEWNTSVYFSGTREGFRIHHFHTSTTISSGFHAVFAPTGNEYAVFSVDFAFPSVLRFNKSSSCPSFPQVDFFIGNNGYIFKEPLATTPLSQILSNGEYENLINGNGIILRDAGGSSYPAGTRWRLKVVDGVLTLEQLT